MASPVVPARSAVPIGTLDAAQRRIALALIAGASAAVAAPNIAPNKMMDPAAVAMPAGSAPEVCGATAPG